MISCQCETPGLSNLSRLQLRSTKWASIRLEVWSFAHFQITLKQTRVLVGEFVIRNPLSYSFCRLPKSVSLNLSPCPRFLFLECYEESLEASLVPCALPYRLISLTFQGAAQLVRACLPTELIE